MTLLFWVFLCLTQDEDLIEKLRSPSTAVREAAERRLREAGDAARPSLEKAARDSDPEVAIRAGALLRRIELRARLTPRLLKALPDFQKSFPNTPDSAWTQALLEATRQEFTRRSHPELTVEDIDPLAGPALFGATPEERERICHIVRNWRLGSAGPELARWLEDPAVGVRGAAAEALTELEYRQATPQVLQALRTEQDEWQRKSLIALLGVLEAQEAIPDLVALLRRPDPKFQRRGELDAAIRALVRIGSDEVIPDLVDLRLSGTLGGDTYIQRALSDLNAAKALVLLKERARNPAQGLDALCSIADLRSRVALPDIRELLKNPDYRVRVEALGSISGLHDRESIPQVRVMADVNEGAMEFISTRTLASLRDQAAIPHIRHLLKQSQQPDLLGFLWQLDPTEAVPEVLEILRHGGQARIAAAYFLGFWGKDRYVEDIAPLLKDSDRFARLNGCTALSWAGTKRVLPLIAPLLKDPEASGNAAEALGYLRIPEAAEALRSAWKDAGLDRNWMAVRALGRAGDRASIPLLKTLLDYGDNSVRKAAIAALEELHADDALPLVRTLLTDDFADVRLQAALWLTRSGSREGIPIILRNPMYLFALNALRQPTLWKSLGDQRFEKGFTDWDLPGLESLSKATGLKLDISPTFPGSCPPLMFRATDAQQALEMSGIILDPGRLRVVSGREALEFWKTWWTSEQNRPK